MFHHHPRRASPAPAAAALGFLYLGATAIAAAAPEIELKQDETHLATGTVVAWGGNLDGQTDIPAGLSGVKAIAAGSGFSLALKHDGSVVAWGKDSAGQATVPADAHAGIAAISAGADHSVALTQDGTVHAWGSDSWGKATVPAGLDSIRAIAAGNSHTVALRENGTVVAWGTFGNDANVPPDLIDVQGIVAGSNHTAALKSDGTVVAWGSFIPPSVPVGLTGVRALAAGTKHVVALKADGTVVAWGDATYRRTVVPIGLTNVQAIAAGGAHSVALKEDGSVVAWGADGNVQITGIPAGLARVRAIAAGSNHSMAIVDSIVTFADQPAGVIGPAKTFTIRNDGTDPLNISGVSVTGEDAADFIVDTAGMTGTIPPGGETTFTVSFPNSSGAFSIRSADLQVLSDDADEGVFQIALSGKPAVPDIAIEDDAGWPLAAAPVVAWGDNLNGQADVPADLTGVRAVAAGTSHSVALKIDGSVVAWGSNIYKQIDVPAGLADVKEIVAGNDHTVALRKDGTLVSWGYNGSNRLTTIPEGVKGIQAIAAGSGHTYALKRDGTVVAWGSDFAPRHLPLDLSNVKAIAAGSSHCVALLEDGTVRVWGDNGKDQRKVPDGLKDVQAIAAKGSHTLALKRDGTVVAWGLNDRNQSDVPWNVQGVSSIAAGASHSLALRGDGRLTGWGWNYYGQASIPEITAGAISASAGGGHGLALLKSSIEFGNTKLGSAVSKRIKVRNTGSETLQISDVIFTGGSSDAFQLDYDDMPATAIPAGGEIHITATFTPDTSGMSLATLRVLSDDPDEGSFEITLVGESTPEISVFGGSSPDAADEFVSTVGVHVFPETLVGGISAAKTFTITNSGESDLTDIYPEITGPGSGDFRIGEMPSTTLSPGATTRFSLNFTPKANGLRNASVAISSNDEDEAVFEIAVRGNAPAPEISIEYPLGNPLTTGKVIAWGYDDQNQSTVPVGLDGVIDIAAGYHHTVALRGDGTVMAWGSNNFDQLQIPEGLSDVKAISAGWFHTLALKADGSIVAWGNNSYGQSSPPAGVFGAQAIEGGWGHSAALTKSGTVISWGNYSYTAVPTGLVNVTAIAAGKNHTLALTASGTVRSWGGGNYHPANITGVTAIAGGNEHSMVLKNDGTVIVGGPGRYGERNVPQAAQNLTAIAAGAHHCLGLKNDGTVVAWGKSDRGQLNIPTGLKGVTAIKAGDSHNVALVDSNVEFGTQPIGRTGEPKAYTIRNIGADLLIISRIEVIGAGSADFSIDTSEMSQSVPVGGETTFTVSLSPTTLGVKHATLRVINNDLDEGVFAIALTGSALPADALQALESWRETHFGIATSTGNAADHFDFDHDGLANILEYAFGTDPTTHGANPIQINSNTVGGFTFSYRRPVGGASGITYGIQRSSGSFDDWSAPRTPFDYSQVSISNGDGTETVTITFSNPMAPKKLFARIVISY